MSRDPLEDPLFDPWDVGEDVRPAPPPRPSRWRAASAATPGMPRVRPAPTPIVPRADRETPPSPPAAPASETSSRTAPAPETSYRAAPARDESPAPSRPPSEASPTWFELPSSGLGGRGGRADPASVRDSGAISNRPPPAAPAPDPLLEPLPPGEDAAPSEPDLLGDVWDVSALEPSEPTPPETVAPPVRVARSATLESAAASLLETLVPRVEAASQRLVTAGHRTMVDDRLDQRPPSYRFRVVPWLGPFDESETDPGAVLEVVVEGRRGDSLVGRVWLDPYAAAPTEERSIPRSELSPAWVDELLLGLVAGVLKRY